MMAKKKAPSKATKRIGRKPAPVEPFVFTPKQEKFIEIYTTNGDQLSLTECARRAGYTKSSAPQIGSQFLNGRDYPHVTQRIREIKAEQAKKYEVTFENHVMMLAKIRDEALKNGAYAPAVSAEKARGQAAGLYIDRKEILHGRIDQMSRDEVVKELAKLQSEYPELRALLSSNLVIEGESQVIQELEDHSDDDEEEGDEVLDGPEGADPAPEDFLDED